MSGRVFALAGSDSVAVSFDGPFLAGPGQAYMRLCPNKDFASSLQKKKTI
jgi:hypothetical protein